MNDDTPIRAALAEALSPYYGALTQASIDTIIAATMRRLAATEPAEPLAEIAKSIEIMLASAVTHGDEYVTGYTIKTGALHRILGILAGAGHPVELLVSTPEPKTETGHE